MGSKPHYVYVYYNIYEQPMTVSSPAASVATCTSFLGFDLKAGQLSLFAWSVQKESVQVYVATIKESSTVATSFKKSYLKYLRPLKLF